MVPCYGDCAGMAEDYDRKNRREAKNSFRALSEPEKQDIQERKQDILASLHYMRRNYKGLSYLIDTAINSVNKISG